MQRISERMHLHVALRGSLITLIAVLLGGAPLWAHPEKGTPAPSLERLNLLQVPRGARADWASLKGKVVVLEFWATWCSPCVASLPRFNQLVESLDPAKFQFISVDDEDPKAVQNFLTKKKMSGWVGLDASGAVFHQYGVASRPTTIIIDGGGKIVAATEIDSLNAADLQAVADGRAVAFKPVMEIIESNVPSRPNAERPLFSVSITKASADAKMSRVNHPPTGTDMLGEDADSLLADIFNVFGNRYVLKAPLPEGRYDVRVNSADVPDPVNDSVVQQALLAAFQLQVQSKTLTRATYVLRATAASKRLLSQSASTHAVKRGYWHGKFLLMNGTMDDLVYVLATGLENPVTNETGVDGTYDARFEVPGEVNIGSLNAVLGQTLGLELVPGNQEMSITVLEMNKQEESKPLAPTKTQETKH